MFRLSTTFSLAECTGGKTSSTRTLPGIFKKMLFFWPPITKTIPLRSERILKLARPHASAGGGALTSDREDTLANQKPEGM